MPKHQASKLSRFKPIRPANAQKILIARGVPLRAVFASTTPEIIALSINSHNASLAPCSQCCRAVTKPSRRARNRPRTCRRSASEPWVVRALRQASLSSSRPVCSSRKRTVSQSQSVCKCESESVTSIPLNRSNSTIVHDIAL